MDIGTGLAVFGAAKMVEKLLGPTASYIGEGVRDWAAKRTENVKNIFENAAGKLGDKIEEEGHIPPRVLKEILDEGSYSDDFISVEYFGGVLASSRTGIDWDDRGKYFASLIGRMSTYHLRAHYVFYHVFKREFNGNEFNIGLSTDADNMGVFISMNCFKEAMDLEDEENFYPILQSCISVLVKEDLLGMHHCYGDIDFMKTQYKGATEAGIIVYPSTLGTSLFMWVYNLANEHVQNLINEEFDFEIDKRVNLNNDFCRVH